MARVSHERGRSRATFEEVNDLRNTIIGIHRVPEHLLDEVIIFGKVRGRGTAMNNRKCARKDELNVNEDASVRDPNKEEITEEEQVGDKGKERNEQKARL